MTRGSLPFLLLSTCLALTACTGGGGILGGPSGGQGPGGKGGQTPDGDDGDDGEAPSAGGRPNDDSGSGNGGGTDPGTTPVDDDADVQLTFSDCSPDLAEAFVATNVVAYDSIAVTNPTAPMSGGVQIALKSASPRTVQLSTTQRTSSENSVVINVYAGGTTYTNLCNSSSPTGCTYDPELGTWTNDPVSGTFTINQYEPKTGKLDVAFSGVVLAAITGSASDTCSVSGTLKTKRLSH